MHRFSLIFLFLVACSAILGQSGVMRVELPTMENSDYYEAIPMGISGVLVIHETAEVADTEHKKWVFTVYDTTLAETWQKEVPVLFGAEFQAFDIQGRRVHLCFVNNRKAKTSIKNLHILTFDMATRDLVPVYGVVSEKSEVVDFMAIGNTGFLGLNVRKSNAELYAIDLSTGQSEKLSLNVFDQNLIESMYKDTLSNTMNLIIAAYAGKQKEALTIFEISTGATILSSYEILPAVTDKYLVSARMMRASDGNIYVTGTYNMEPDRLPGDEETQSGQAAGVFICSFNDGVQEFIYYYNFLEFSNLRTGLSRKDYYKMQRRMAKDGSEFSFNYSLILHDLEWVDNQLVLFMESYYPDFKTVSDITYDYWGRPIPQSYTVFEGYKYINALLTGFSPDGRMLWDNSLEMYNINTFDLHSKVTLATDSTDIVLFYNEGGRITYKAFDKGTSLTELVNTSLDPYYRGDNLQEAGFEKIIPWYGKYFLCKGYQRISNASLVDLPRRTIFYMSKVAFE